MKLVLDGVVRGALHPGDVVSPHELEVSRSSSNKKAYHKYEWSHASMAWLGHSA